MDGKKVGFAVAGSVLAVIVFFSFVELSTRLVSWATGKGFSLALHELDARDEAVESVYQWHPFVGFILRPSNHIRARHPNQQADVVVSVDRYGFLAETDSLSREKPAGEIRIAFIGGSTTANLNLAAEENFPGIVRAVVQDALADRKVRSINAGIPGFDTAMSLGNLALRVMPFAPDVVVIYHAYNDLKAVAAEAGFRPDYSHVHTRPFGFGPEPNPAMALLHRSMFYVRTRNLYREHRKAAEFERGLVAAGRAEGRIDRIPAAAVDAFSQHIRSMVGIARSGGAKVVLLSFATLLDPALDIASSQVQEALDERQKMEVAFMAHFVPGLTVPAIFEGIRTYNAALVRVAAEERTGWVDMAAKIPHEHRYFLDRVHFSPAGSREMARHLAPAVIDCLQKTGPGDPKDRTHE